MSLHYPQKKPFLLILGTLFVAYVCVLWWLKAGKDESEVSPKLLYRACDHFPIKTHGLKCYYFKTDGGFKLPLVLFERLDGPAQEDRDVLIQIPGGPGQGLLTRDDEIRYWLEWLEGAKMDADLLIYDPRGTGDGQPVWDCEKFESLRGELISKNIDLEAELNLITESIVTCLKIFETKIPSSLHGDSQGLMGFSSLQQADDVVQMAEALGYRALHLWGTSYGTRVALVAAENANVKSLILDSVYPFERGLESEWPLLYVNSFNFHERLFGMVFPDELRPYADIFLQAASHTKNGITLSAENWESGETAALVLNEHRLLEMSYNILYSSYLYRPYYEGLLEFANSGEVNSDFQLVLDHFMTQILAEGFNLMVYFATECVDKRIDEGGGKGELSRFSSDLFSHYKHYFELNNAQDICGSFIENRAAMPVLQGRHYEDKPTLIFAGEFDPVTPVTWAQELARQLPLAKLIEVENAGHGVLFSADCDWSFINNYINNPEVDSNPVCVGENLWR